MLIIVLEVMILGFFVLRGVGDINNLLDGIHLASIEQTLKSSDSGSGNNAGNVNSDANTNSAGKQGLNRDSAESERAIDLENMEWNSPGDAPWTKRDAHTSVVFQDKIWIMGGIRDGDVNLAYEYHIHESDVWNSSDGKNWELVTDNAEWGRRRAHSSVVFQTETVLVRNISLYLSA